MNQLRDRPINAERAESFSVLEAAAAALSRLTRECADFAPWLKDGETPIERLHREHEDNQALLGKLATALRERNEAREALSRLVELLGGDSDLRW
jgi:hypothetical protein